MSRHTVIWWPPALDDLTVLWMDSSDRDSIRNAADVVDRMLIENPSTKGSQVREGYGNSLVIRSWFNSAWKKMIAE